MHFKVKIISAISFAAVAIAAALLATFSDFNPTSLLEQSPKNKMEIVDEMLDAAFNKFIPLY